MLARVEVVWTDAIGTSLFEDATAGDTTIYVASVQDFYAGGGVLVLDGNSYVYENKISTVSPEGARIDSLDISPPLAGDADLNTSVFIDPEGESKWALVRFTSAVNIDAVKARIPHALSAFFAVSGIRAPEAREYVEVERQETEWVVVDILGKTPKLAPEALPPPSDGVPPAVSPAVNVSPGLNALYLRWTPVDNADPVRYRIYVDTITPVASISQNLVGETGSTFTVVAEDGPGNPLVPGTDYYVMVLASDVDGDGPDGATSGPQRIVQAISEQEWQEHQDAIDQLGEDLEQAQTELGNRVRVVYQSEQPVLGSSDRVMWYDTDDGNHSYFWDGTSWVDLQDENIDVALQSADGKSTVHYGGAEPPGTDHRVGDTWFDSSNDNRIMRWDGTSWVDVALAAGALADGAVTSAKIAPQAVTNDKIAPFSISNSSIAPFAIAVRNIVSGTHSIY